MSFNPAPPQQVVLKQKARPAPQQSAPSPAPTVPSAPPKASEEALWLFLCLWDVVLVDLFLAPSLSSCLSLLRPLLRCLCRPLLLFSHSNPAAHCCHATAAALTTAATTATTAALAAGDGCRPFLSNSTTDARSSSVCCSHPTFVLLPVLL